MIQHLEGNSLVDDKGEKTYLKYVLKKSGFGIEIMVISIGFGIILTVVSAIVLSIFEQDLSSSEYTPFIMGGLGIILLTFASGIFIRNLRLKKYHKYYVKGSRYTREEIIEFENEFYKRESILFYPYKSTDKAGHSKKDVAAMTDNWLLCQAGLKLGLYRLVDIAVIWYNRKGRLKGDKYNPALIIINAMGDLDIFPMEERVGKEIMQEVYAQNTTTISIRKFIYKNQKYDAFKQPWEVAAIYRELFRRKNRFAQ